MQKYKNIRPNAEKNSIHDEENVSYSIIMD